MPLFDNSPVDNLSTWVEQQRSKVEVDKSQSVPLDGQTVVPNPPETPITPVAVEEKKEQEPKLEETPKPEVVEEQPLAWDADETIAAEAPKSIFDFKSIGSALQLGEIKDESELIAKVNELVVKKKELEDKPLAGVPEEFREVLEVAKRGENWKEYVKQDLINFNNVDPITLYEDALEKDAMNNPHYKTADGKFNSELFEQDLATIPDIQKFSQGKQLQQFHINQQNLRKAELKAKAEAKVANADTTLSQATQKLSEILPFENYGIKFEPKHSVEIYKGITDSSLTKKHLGVTYEKLVESGADMKQIARTITLAEKGEKMIKYGSANAEAKAKKALLASTQNVQLDNNGSRATPVEPSAKVLTPAEKIALHMQKQNKPLFG